MTDVNSIATINNNQIDIKKNILGSRNRFSSKAYLYPIDSSVIILDTVKIPVEKFKKFPILKLEFFSIFA